MIIIGIKMIRNNLNWSIVFFKSVWKSLIYFETAKATVILTNSLGCRLKLAIENHESAPFTLFPKKNKHTKITIDKI